MRTSHLLSAITLGVCLAAGGIAITPALAQASKSAPAARQVKSIPQIHDQLAAQGYTKIDKIERDGNHFEVNASDKNGERVKLYLDDQTGAILEKEQEQRNSDKLTG